MATCTIQPMNGGYALKTPYNAGFVAQLKVSIPTTERKFDPNSKVWIVSANYGQTAQQLIMTHFGELVMIPQMSVKAVTQMRLLEVRYLGSCKPREDGSLSAFAWVDGQFNAIFPEQALRDWFETGPAPVQAPSQASTLYSMLGVTKTAGTEDIKTAFRKMARQWHPDVCKEPNAAEMFIRLKEASDILSDPRERGRYDAGLAMEATLKQPVRQVTQWAASGYQSPLRCGLIMVEGTDVIGRFVVGKILQWEDITSGGKVLVASWPMDAKRPVENWV
jgi:hypothetical protein